MEVCSDKTECKVSAKRMWKGAFLDAHNCMPKASPHAISHISYDDPALGFSQPGCCRTVHYHASYVENLAKEKNIEHMGLIMKEKLVEVDHQALKFKIKHLEGGFMGILVKQAMVSVHLQEGSTPNTCVGHWSVEYEAFSEDVKARIPSAFKNFFPRIIKQMEEYLLSHDDYKDE